MAEWKKSGNMVEKFHYPPSQHSHCGLKSSDQKSKWEPRAFWFVHVIDALLALLVSIHIPYTIQSRYIPSQNKGASKNMYVSCFSWRTGKVPSCFHIPTNHWSFGVGSEFAAIAVGGSWACSRTETKNMCSVSPFHPSCTSESIQMYLMHLYWHKCFPSLYNTGNVYIVYMMRLETLMERNRGIINSMTHFGHSTTRV